MDTKGRFRRSMKKIGKMWDKREKKPNGMNVIGSRMTGKNKGMRFPMTNGDEGNTYSSD